MNILQLIDSAKSLFLNDIENNEKELKSIISFFSDFLVANGDILTDLDFGVLDTDETNTLVCFREKPVSKYKVVDYIPEDTFYGFDHLMLDQMIMICKVNL